MSETILRKKPSDYAGLVFNDDHCFLQATTPPNPKGLPKNRKRLARIKRNLLRELEAFNKEMRRHPPTNSKELGANK